MACQQRDDLRTAIAEALALADHAGETLAAALLAEALDAISNH